MESKEEKIKEIGMRVQEWKNGRLALADYIEKEINSLIQSTREEVVGEIRDGLDELFEHCNEHCLFFVNGESMDLFRKNVSTLLENKQEEK